MEDFFIMRGSSKIDLDNLIRRIATLSGKSTVQLFDPDKIKSRAHIIGAYINAVSAFKNKTNRSNSISMEMLLFAACTDQIAEAIKVAGAKSNKDFIIFCNDTKLLAKMKWLSLREFNKKSTRESDLRILQKMALSRLDS